MVGMKSYHAPAGSFSSWRKPPWSKRLNGSNFRMTPSGTTSQHAAMRLIEICQEPSVRRLRERQDPWKIRRAISNLLVIELVLLLRCLCCVLVIGYIGTYILALAGTYRLVRHWLVPADSNYDERTRLPRRVSPCDYHTNGKEEQKGSSLFPSLASSSS